MTIIACHDCDALQDEPKRVPRGTIVSCWRCKAVLRRHARPASEILALVVAATILFVIANVFPIASLQAGGNEASTTLAGGVAHLWAERRELVAVLVFVTTILAPAADLAAMTYLLVGVMRFDAGKAPTLAPGSATILRAVQSVRAWGMLEVFLMGVLVSIVKLDALASVIVGGALYSLGALVLLVAGINARFDPRDIWKRIPAEPAASGAARGDEARA